jgi:hypothetical protein
MLLAAALLAMSLFLKSMVRSYAKSCEGAAWARREIGRGQSAATQKTWLGTDAPSQGLMSVHLIVLLAILPFSYIAQTCTRIVEQSDLPFQWATLEW